MVMAMKKNGFILVDVLTGLFILGLVVVFAFPIILSSGSSYSSVKISTEMNYLGESIYERLNSRDEYSNKIIDELIISNEVIFDDFDLDYADKYQCKIVNLNQNDILVDILIIIKYTSGGGKILDVEYKASICK